jgi:prevent-host-death family protein
MNEANQPTTVTVRALLAHFHSILDQAQRTGEPVIIAHRRRQPAGVLQGYEAWEAGRAKLAAERQRGASLAADLAAARQRVKELEAQLARPQPSGEAGATWRVTPASAAPASPPETGLSWSSTAASAAPAPPAPSTLSGWGQS